MKVKLPNGLIDDQDHFDVVMVDEIYGRQQNYLATRELVVGNIGHIPKLIEELVISLETETGIQWQGDKKQLPYLLSAGDLETILIKIRENTYGPRFYFEVECPHCGTLNKDNKLELDKLEIDKMPLDEILDKSKRTFKLPKSGKEVELKALYLKDMFDSISVMSDKQDKLITSVVAMSLKRIDDKTKITEDDVGKLPMSDIHWLEKKLEDLKLEGTIDTDIEGLVCKGCKKEFDSKLNVFEPNFFDPSRGTPTSNT